MYSVYLHKRKTDNSVFYIGIGNNKRPYVKSNRSKFWKNEVNKHDYNVEILSNNLTWENAQEAEIYLINLYGRRDNNTGCLVNLTDGGDGSPGTIVSNETKLKLSKSMKGKNKGNKNPMFGKNPYLNKKHYRSKEIINIKTLEIYSTINDVLKIYKIPKTTLLRWLQNENLNKTDFRLLK